MPPCSPPSSLFVANCADDESTRAQQQRRQQQQPTQNQQTQSKPAAGTLLTGHDAMGDWTTDAPGVRRRAKQTATVRRRGAFSV